MKGLILAGGHGTRLRPLTHTISKQLIPIANKPMLFYGIETLKEAGIADIGIIVGHTPERIKEIKEAVGDGSKWGINITYIEQDAPRGIAHAVSLAEDFMENDPFVVYLGDNLIKGGIKEYVEKFKSSDYDAGVFLTRIPNPERFGVAIIEDGKVVGLVEKPKIPPSDLTNTGIYMFRKSVFDVIRTLKPSFRNELEISETQDKLLRSGKHKVMVEIIKGWWKDTGKPEDLLEANHLVLNDLEAFNRGKVEEGVTIIGKVGIEENTIIKRGTTIRGPVIIGKNCEIGPDAYICPYTSVGDNTIIKNVEIESSIIVGDSKIECKKRIIDSLIGKNVTIISAEDSTPKTVQVVLGENSFISI